MRKVFFLISILLLAGCNSNKLVSNYDKMKIGSKGINGYSLDLRIYGINDSKKVNEIIRIEDYNNREYQITKADTSTLVGRNVQPKEDAIYVINGKTYIANKDGNYSATTKGVDYNNPSVYLEGLKDIAKASKPTKEKIGDNTYDVYDVIFSKNVVSDILKDTDLENVKVNNNADGKVYIDSKGYVYRIIYNIDKLTINANYFGINTARSINLPIKLETAK